jgi:hypothetical protein
MSHVFCISGLAHNNVHLWLKCQQQKPYVNFITQCAMCVGPCFLWFEHHNEIISRIWIMNPLILHVYTTSSFCLLRPKCSAKPPVLEHPLPSMWECQSFRPIFSIGQNYILSMLIFAHSYIRQEDNRSWTECSTNSRTDTDILKCLQNVAKHWCVMF